MSSYSRYKHLFFDVDNTLSRSRSLIEPEFHAYLTTLPHDIVIMSGQKTEDIFRQARELDCIRMGQNGNHAIDRNGNELWNEPLTEAQKTEIMAHIDAVHAASKEIVKDENDLIEDRGAQLCYSFIGHHEDVSKKEVWDPDRKKREKFLEQFPFESEIAEVKIGGTASFDYIGKGKHKGFNVTRIIDHYGWDPDACIYFGDRLHPGGNDETVIGIIDTQAVTDHNHTFELVKKHFS